MSLKAAAAYVLVLTAAGSASFPALALDPPGEEAITFTAASGETVDAFRGGFEAPENRADPESRMIPVRYMRFPATGEDPGPPIVYLAGGPGGSGIGTARGRRFPLFMAMRAFGDVIALDQRGTGEAKDTPTCRSSITPELDERYSAEEIAEGYRMAVDECGAFWRSEDVDVAGYTTRESVADLDALRAHLGAETITLWGISYGSHLALAALKEMDDRIDRVVVASAEGLDQTVKLPAETDAYFARLQAVIDEQPEARATFPDIAGLIRRVHARLEDDPPMLQVPQPDGSTADVLLTVDTMQVIASGSISDPGRAARLLQLYAAVDGGILEPAADVLARYLRPDEPITFEAMPLAMDVASGISEERLALVEEQARTSLLGLYLNFPMPQVRGALGLDLGDDFRAPPESDVPTLLLTGTLDGRTYPAEQRAATAGLSNLTHVTVVNAGHNLFMTSAEVTEVIERFMRGEAVETREIMIDPPSFAPEPPG